MFSFKKMAAAAALACSLMSGTAQADTTLLLDPSATFLRTSELPELGLPHDAVAYSLADLGFSAGDTIILTRRGAYATTSGAADISASLLAIFSSTSTLLGAVNTNAGSNALIYTPEERVTGALATTLPAVISKNAYHGLSPSDSLNTLSTDIAQDFSISKSGTTVVIPTGAQYIFFSANDNLFGDNTDPNNDYGVTLALAPVPEPSSTLMLLSGVLGLAGIAARRSKR